MNFAYLSISKINNKIFVITNKRLGKTPLLLKTGKKNKIIIKK